MNRLSMFARVQEHYLGLRLPAALWPALAIVAFGVWASRDSETPITLPSNVIISSAEAVGLPASASVADADHIATADDSHTRLEAPIKVERNERVQRWRVLHPGLVRSKFGASARVAHMHTAKFQCLVDWLDDQGFRIKSKTCNFGPMAGFVCRNALFSKKGAEYKDEQEKRYAQALDKFQRVAAVKESGSVRYRIGSVLEALGRLREARDAFRAIAGSKASLPEKE